MSNELDKQFSDRLVGYESAIDAESLWEAVKPPRKKKPWTWLWLLLMGGIVLLSAYAYWGLDGKQENTITASAAVVFEKETTSKHENLAVTAEPKATSGIAGINSKVDNTAGGRSGKRQEETTSSQLETTSPATKTTILPVAKSHAKLPDDVSANEDNTNTSDNLKDVVGNMKDAISDVTASTEENTAEEHLNSGPLESVKTFTERQTGTVSPVPILNGPLSTQINTALPDLSIVPEESYSNKRSPWFLQLDAGYYALHRSLNNNDTIVDGWLAKREQTESLLEASSLDVTLGYELSKRWELRTGVAYTQINTAFNYSTSSIVVDTIEDGPTVVYTTTVQEKRTYNSFRQWDVPLLLAYNFGAGQLHYQAEAGIRLLVQRQWEGSVLSDSNEFVDLTEEDWYRGSLDLSFQAGLKAVYDLNSHTSVLGGFNVRYQPQHFTTDNAPFKERYQLLGASIGLRHNF